MNQIELLEISQQMPPGQRIEISDEEMISCVEGNLRSPLLDGPVRQEDIVEFIKQISENWHINVIQNYVKNTWIIIKKD